MAMLGAVQGSAMLVTWDDPYTDITVDYAVERSAAIGEPRAAESAKAIQLQPLEKGGYVESPKPIAPSRVGVDT
jgi:hypothetical protein